MVLMSDELHISKSLGKQLRQIAGQQESGDYSVVVTTNQAFEAVMQGCAARGEHGQDTWITVEMKQAYQQWHAAGAVHSVETWIDGQLVGGLYGVCLGRMFFGESMFTRATNASKIALVHLVRFLQRQGVSMIDCQMQTDHLALMGARNIAREVFIDHVSVATDAPAIDWHPGWLDTLGNLQP